jgi:flagellar assembly factor FliW
MMSAKDRVFNVMDLFYDILDFLPGAFPLTLKSVSKTWRENAGKCRFHNFWVSIKPFRDIITNEDKWDIDQTNFPLHLIYRVRAASISYHDMTGLEKCLSKFSRLRELEISDCSETFPIAYLQNIKKLRLNFYSDRSRNKVHFDGSELELMKTLCIDTLDKVYQDQVKLPPNLTDLKVMGTMVFANGNEYFPITLTKLDIGSAIGALSINTLPKNLKWFKTFSKVASIPSSVTDLCIGGSIEGIKYEHLHSLELHDEQSCEVFSFKHITTLKIDNHYAFNVVDLPSTLTELEMNVNDYAPLQTENLPYSLLLLCLRITTVKYQPKFFKLPPRMRRLKMEYFTRDGFHGDSFLSVNDFPDSLTELNITCRNIRICEGMLPRNLRGLFISAASLFMAPYSIPDSVTSLNIPRHNGTFERNVLPNGLTYLRVSSGYETWNALKSYFPLALTHINWTNYKIPVSRPFEVLELNDGGKWADRRPLWKTLLNIAS